MYAIRKRAATFLLFVMACAIAPQEYWHVWAHNDVAAHAPDANGTVETTCAFCDSGLLAGTVPVVAIVRLVPAHHARHAVPRVSGTALGFTLNAGDRGPPAKA